MDFNKVALDNCTKYLFRSHQCVVVKSLSPEMISAFRTVFNCNKKTPISFNRINYKLKNYEFYTLNCSFRILFKTVTLRKRKYLNSVGLTLSCALVQKSPFLNS